MKVLHVLANSPPDVNGYAVRTKMILESIERNDIAQCVALTSPWYPDRDSMVESVEINKILYHRTIHPSRKKNTRLSHKLVSFFTPKKSNYTKISEEVSPDRKNPIIRILHFFYFGIFKVGRLSRFYFRLLWKVIEEKILVKYFTKRIIQVATESEVDIIHAHTPYRVGLPGLLAARKLKKPFVYEMRGIWEETAVANGRWSRNGPAYRRFQNLENRVLRQADAVVCISQTLKDEAIKRGVEESKIAVVTNAVTVTETKHSQQNEILKLATEQLSQNDELVVGYIGSLRKMEGVDFTAQAVAKLVERGHNVQFFVLTGESGQAELKSYCGKLGIQDRSVILGPVPHEEVKPFFDLIDIFVVSRPDSVVTRLVTPLKPFEAMAMGKTVVASNLDALREIISHNETGLLFEAENLENLTDTIESCIVNEELRNLLSKQALEFVNTERSWDKVTEEYKKMYSVLRKGR